MDLTWEMPPPTPEEQPIPGSHRRNWVYREMALLGIPDIAVDDADESPSRASPGSDSRPRFRPYY
jgi:hypothetical protein